MGSSILWIDPLSRVCKGGGTPREKGEYVGIDIGRLRPDLQRVLLQPDMEAVRQFVSGYDPDPPFGTRLDEEDPITEIVQRTGDQPFVEILFNIVLRGGIKRKVVRCTISRRGLRPTVGVVMITTEGHLVLMDEYRPQSGRTYISVPTGSRKWRQSFVAAALEEGRVEGLYETTGSTKIYQLPAFGYHGAMLSMLETVVVVTNVKPIGQLGLLRDMPDDDEWITRRRAVPLAAFYKLVREPPEYMHLHGPALACVLTAQAHGFLLPSAETLSYLSGIQRGLPPVTRE